MAVRTAGQPVYGDPAIAQDVIVVTADRQPGTVERTTASVSVVDQEDARERGYPGNAWQWLSGTPGTDLLAANGGIDGGVVSPRLRGTNPGDAQVLVDGIPINNPSLNNGQADLATIDGAGLERIEVVRGSQSGLYGSQAVGGVINLLTARPTTSPEVKVRGEGGSYGTAHLDGSATGPIGDTLGYAVAVGGTHSDGFSSRTDNGGTGKPGSNEADSVDRMGANARLEARPSSRVMVYGAVRTDDANQEYDSSSDPNTDAYIQRYRSWRVAGGGEASVGIASFTLDAARTTQTRHNEEGSAPNNIYRGVEDYFGGQMRAEILKPDRERGAALDRATLTLGADATRDQAMNDVSFSGKDYSLVESAQKQGAWGQILAGDRYLEFSQTGRLDLHSREGRNGTYRSGLALFPVDACKIHGSVATGFRAPSLYELYDGSSGNPDLQAQRTQSYDLGHDTRLPGDLTLSNVWFRTDYQQAIEYVGKTGDFANVSGYRIEGVENSVTWRDGQPGFRFWASWTWQRTDLAEQEIATGRAFNNLPRSKVAVQPAWHHERAWVAVRLDAAGDRQASYGGTLAGYALLGASAGFTVSKTWEIYARGENLTNTDYVINPGYSTAGASGYAGATATF